MSFSDILSFSKFSLLCIFTFSFLLCNFESLRRLFFLNFFQKFSPLFLFLFKGTISTIRIINYSTMPFVPRKKIIKRKRPTTRYMRPKAVKRVRKARAVPYSKAISPASRPSIGSQIGGYLGNAAQNMFSKFLGFGAYDLKQNNMVQTLTPSNQVPFMKSSSTSTRIRHREFIQDFVGSSTPFAATYYPINIGMAQTFPWLSSIARNFSSYRFHGLIFEFKSLSGDDQNKQSQGYVAGAVDYNSDSPFWVTKSQIENAMFSASSKPSTDIIFPVECDPKHNQVSEFYVRSSALASTSSELLYDIGTFTIARGSNLNSTDTIGELWVSYDVELISPILGAGQLALPSAHYTSTNYTNLLPLGSTRTTVFDNMGLTISSTTITFPLGTLGKFALYVQQTGANTGNVVPGSVSFNAGATALISLQNGSASGISAPLYTGAISGPNTSVYTTFTIPSATVQAIITIGTAGTLPTSPSSCDIFVMPLNATLT
ncbi:capsid protein [Crucivirus-277]|nr:capsid protein [Crucivirus-272]QMW68759.1 capsid protein [Crucivirus-277]QMW68765.1 capsid protein [Crucivirus-281]